MKRPFTIETASASIQSSIRNAVISFDEMTVSVIKVTFENNGHQVNGYGFCSNGRYAQEGIIKNRFMPRLQQVSPDSLLDDNGVIDPFKCWSVFMQNEKPGGHGDRAVAAGALVAVDFVHRLRGGGAAAQPALRGGLGGSAAGAPWRPCCPMASACRR